jgi:hypothetical protein
MRAFIIKHAGDCGMDNFDVSVIVQEMGAIFFHLVCLSRLGTKDYYYAVNQEQEYKYNTELTSSLASESKVASTLCLFLALLVFNLPFLNVWLLLSAFVQKKESNKDETPQQRAAADQKRRLTCAAIFVSYMVASVLAWQLVKALSHNRTGSVTWVVSVDLDDYPSTNTNYTTEFFEELVAVCSLLIGVYYFDGTKLPKVEFILKITVLVAALFRAFPGAHLSPHISLYLALMRFSSWESFVFRCLGGGVGFVFVVLWKQIWSLDQPGGYVAVPETASGAAEAAAFGGLGPIAAGGGAAFTGAARVPGAGGASGTGLKITLDGGRYF